MTEQKIRILTSLEDKFDSLSKVCDRLLAENAELKAKLTQTNTELTSIKADNKVLEEKYGNIKLLYSMITGQDAHDAKIRLNKIMREIDKCIELLNK